MTLFQKFLQDETGATAMEYALIIGLIGLAIVTGGTALGASLGERYTSTAKELE